MKVYNEKSPRFTFSQLGPYQDAVRFVTVEPCFDSTDQIVCTLHNSRISENDGYTAISYMWGPTSDHRSPILLDGREFPVRINLWNFLQYAQTALPGRYLWIDAICIDQTETQERNHQVKIMGDIYSSATRVIAWLGRGDPELDSLFDYAQHAQKAHRLLPSTCKPVSYIPNLQANRYLRKGLPIELSHLSWVPPQLVHFLLLPYWQRTWIVQEILLAKRLTFVCGKQSLDYDVLMNMLANSHRFSIVDEEVAVAELSSWHPGSMSRFKGTPLGIRLPSSLRLLLQRSDPHKPIHELKMEELIDTMRETSCSDRRDRIFGSLSLVSMGRTFAIDYEQSTIALVLQVLQHFGGDLHSFEQIASCLFVSHLELCRETREILFGGYPGSGPPIAPIVTFEILNACCCADRARFAHSDSTRDFVLSIPAAEHHEQTSDTPYYQCRSSPDCLALCLKCMRGSSLELLTSSEVKCSTFGLDRKFRESRLINFEGSVPEDFFVVRRNIAFTRPEEGVTRYFMTITMFAELMDFKNLRRNWQQAQREIARMVSPIANAAFLGRFTGGLPAQDTSSKSCTIASLPLDLAESESDVRFMNFIKLEGSTKSTGTSVPVENTSGQLKQKARTISKYSTSQPG